MTLLSIIRNIVLFKQKLGLTSFALSIFVILSGCVSQTTISNSPSREPTIKRAPDLNEAAEQRLNLGLQYLKNGQTERAKHHLDKAFKHAPHKASVLIGLAYYYEQVKEFSRADKYYRKALSIDSDKGDYLNLYGSFLCNQGNYSKAEKYFKKAIKQISYANVTATYENLGVCALRAGHLKRAEASFRRALDHNPNSSISLLEMADLWFQRKNYMKARAFLSRHFANSQGSAKSFWLGIRIERILGDNDALSSYGLKLKGMFPESDEAALYLKSIR